MSTSVTSRTEGQERHFRRLVEDVARHGADLALRTVEADSKGWQWVLDHGDELKSAAAQVIVAKTRELALRSSSQERAREIMGRNFFGAEEAAKHFGVNPSQAQFAALREVPFSEETLMSCKDTHVLVAVFPLSILDIRAKVHAEPQRLFYDQSWYNKEKFAKDRGETGWHLIRKTSVDGSTSKTWDEQQFLLAADEETPTARVVVYTIIGHFLATGERLFERIYVRCSDVDSRGSRVVVGLFGGHGLNVDDDWDDDRHSSIGVASARKSRILKS
ncbi:MAG: hypothetical protein Greene101447_506 [Parcubacteria group bacterium Greene1014_47]|nr:MAG: hypothetical protein Greene101447_506 [Parcubacteria group bacterium Greene1014_47]